MLRFAFAAVMVAPMLLADPPSSLEPSDARGTVALSHQERRVVSCKAEKKGCADSREKLGGTASIALHPIVNPDLTKPDPRKSVTLTLGAQPKSLELRVGTWELEWPGHAKRRRFQVVEGAALPIRLSTTRGECRRTGTRCTLRSDAVTRRIEVGSPDA